MINILCYGDSNTFGYNTATKGRFDYETRWTGLLQKKLGIGYHVIEEGLGGRTTVWDDPIEGDKNGLKYLVPCLHSHAPLDIVIIMLGTNDLKPRFSLNAFDIAQGAGALVKTTRLVLNERQDFETKILLVSPVHVTKSVNTGEFTAMFGYDRSVEISMQLSGYYLAVAEQNRCKFMDAAEIVKPNDLDGIHLDENGHIKLANAFTNIIEEIYLNGPFHKKMV
jgi:lysophospholipase L1-like esterase